MVVLRLALFLMIWTILKSTGQVLCNVCFSWDLSNVFLMSCLGLQFLGISPQSEVNFHYILSKVHAMTMTHRCWCCSPDKGSVCQESHCKVALCALPLLSSLDISHCAQPTLQEWGDRLCPLKGGLSPEVIWNSLNGRAVCSSPIDLFIQWFHYVSMDSYWF